MCVKALRIALFLPFGCLAASAQSCTAPTPEKVSQVTAYVTKRFHLTSATGLSVTASEQASKSCFWRLSLQTDKARKIVVYLSPDQGYLTTALLDLAIDPAIAERQQAEAASKELNNRNLVPTKGDTSAKVSFVEFSDFECPFCKRLSDMLEEEQQKYPGELIVSFRYFPLEMHPWAAKAADAAECAERVSSEAFWGLHDFLFAHQRTLTKENIDEELNAYTASNSLFVGDKYSKCLLENGGHGAVERDTALGQKLGVHGTPTVFLNGIRMEPARTAAELHTSIQAALATAGSSSRTSISSPASEKSN